MTASPGFGAKEGDIRVGERWCIIVAGIGVSLSLGPVSEESRVRQAVSWVRCAHDGELASGPGI